MKSLFDSNDIMKLFKELDRKIDKLWCQVEELFERSPINIGSGIGLYKRLFRNHWEFKSLKAGNNITITSLDSEVEISTTAEPIDCQDIKDCIGIDPFGDPTLFLNQQGDYLSVNSFSCNDLLNCSTDNLPEGITNLYFTNSRAISALTGQNISLFLNNVGYITLSSLSAGTGISYNNLTGVITNTAPDQTVVLTAGTGISVSGTYPNFTIANSSPSSGGTVTSVNGSGGTTGLTLTGGAITTSGTLTLGGILNPANGGTGQNTSASTGIAQVNSGTWSISTALTNGTTATTQSTNDNSTKVATTAYVDTAVSAASVNILQIQVFM